MDEHTENTALIRRYLLGEASEDEGERVERLLLTNHAEFENALILEDELADDYAQGFLSESERSSFESNYLRTNERRQKMWFAHMLKAHARGKAKTLRERPERLWRRCLRWARRIRGEPTDRFAIVSSCILLLMIVLTLSLAHQTVKLRTNLEKEQNRRREI